jgi:hypothetical protein
MTSDAVKWDGASVFRASAFAAKLGPALPALLSGLGGLGPGA